MNIYRLYFIIIIFAIISCDSNPKANNKELETLYNRDQSDRKGKIDWSIISLNDSLRRNRVSDLIKTNMLRTGTDYYHAAMIFQHGRDTIASSLAVQLMQNAIKLDPTIDNWLLAAAIDRDLMRKKLPQIYGTQFIRKDATSPWQLYQIDTTKISDEERKKFSVPPLAKQRLRVIEMNKK